MMPALTPAQLKAHLRHEIDLYLPTTDIALIERAYAVAEAAHTGQNRKSGEPYIIHPLATADILASYRLDAQTLAAALLHDVPEDTQITLANVRQEFGDEIAALVDGVTKLSQVRLKKEWQNISTLTKGDENGENFEAFHRQVETLRKMFLAMSRDVRVILIKLADRLHNMRTLSALPSQKQLRIAQETLEVYTPLANRLGIGQLKGELEDLSFQYAYPDDYKSLKQMVSQEITVRQRYIERVRRVLLKRLAAIGIRAEAHGRAKHDYSLWKKLQREENNLDEMYDLVAVRVIVPTIEDCYRALGLVHQMWKPLPGRIKDYIAMPKPNGYQSLHTTVFSLGGRITEIQIRTPEMHHQAEFGIAAHWAYKEASYNDRTKSSPSQPLAKGQLTWITQLAQLQNTMRDPAEWHKGLALDFFEDRIFVFTPVGDVLDLPSKATPVDFAFEVHSDLGRHCVGAKVNGKMVPLSHPLTNGDIIEILTSGKTSPKRDWLQFVKSSKARTMIKRALYTAETELNDEHGGSRGRQK